MAKLRAPTSKPVVIRGVRPNAGVRAWYQSELERHIVDMARNVTRECVAAYNEMAPSIGMAADAGSSWLLRKAMEKWGTLWTKRMDALSDQLSTAFADRATRMTETQVKQAFKASGFTIQFAPTKGSRDAYEAIRAQQVGLIKSIPQQYLKDVEQRVWQSVMQGGNLGTLREQLQQAYGLSYKRAAFIARDQNNKATAIIQNERRRELGITDAIWQHSHAGKEPRPSHVAAHGKRYKIADGMVLDGKRTWPGMEPNCRCTDRAVVLGLDDD